jgi:hypothetical protein
MGVLIQRFAADPEVAANRPFLVTGYDTFVQFLRKFKSWTIGGAGARPIR